MSDKSDRDNRSNQLNSNNSAYHSSRTSGSSDDDDDYSYSSSGVTASIRSWTRQQENSTRYLTFFIDFVLLNGDIINMKSHSEIHGMKTKGAAEDGAIAVMRAVNWYITARFKSNTAYCGVRVEGGADMEWACDTYKPKRIPFKKTPEYLAKIVEEDDLWFLTGEKAVQEFKAKLSSGVHIERLDLGEFDQNNIFEIQTGLAQKRLIHALKTSNSESQA